MARAENPPNTDVADARVVDGVGLPNPRPNTVVDAVAPLPKEGVLPSPVVVVVVVVVVERGDGTAESVARR